MNQKELAELLKYASPYSILVINYQNKIMELKCPFRVVVKNDVGILIKSKIELVELVKISKNLKTVFIVKGKAYYYHHFYILID